VRTKAIAAVDLVIAEQDALEQSAALMRVLNKYRDGFPAGSVNVMRPGPLGNFYPIKFGWSRERVLSAHLRDTIWRINRDERFRLRVWALWDHDLVCVCAPLQCHGHTLRWCCELLNEGRWDATVHDLRQEKRKRKTVPLPVLAQELGLRWR
jgi:hypothetical protein